jgi:dipeptidase E
MRKLYLSSYMIGDHADRLLSLVGGTGGRMAVITNALDYIPIEDQLAHARTRFDPVAYFSNNGFDPSLVDLRVYFGRQEALASMLARHKVVWALGGNAFLLRRAMKLSGFDAAISDLLDEGLTYSGWSAGACVAGDSLRAIALMDDPHQMAPGYPDMEPVWEGLDLVPFTVIPHHDSDHPEQSAAQRAVSWAEDNQVPYKALRDGEVILSSAGSVELLSQRSTISR